MASRGEALTVLVVDDDPDIRGLIRRTLEADDTVVLEAGDGVEALATIRVAPVAVVILDVELPGMSGLDVVRQLRPSHRDLHVIMISAHGAEHDRVAALMGGADDFMAKPFSPSELAARVVAAGRRLAARPPSDVVLGPLRIDPVARVADVDGRRLGLTRLHDVEGQAIESAPRVDAPPVSDPVQRALRAVREHLGLDVAFVAKFVDGRRVFRHVDSRPDISLRPGRSERPAGGELLPLRGQRVAP
jgi:CheY-like chemotaxis protein